MLQEYQMQAQTAVCALLEQAHLSAGDFLVVGCSSSEVLGKKIGTDSSMDAARAIFDGIYPILNQRGIFLAAQCCEHLNRALIIEQQAAKLHHLEIVNARPQPKAGGSFATCAWEQFTAPCAVEQIRAAAGMDIGNTLIGMHLAAVAVPVRLTITRIGEANLVCARTRPKFIGGIRAQYDEKLL